jgi:hypothetical protein
MKKNALCILLIFILFDCCTPTTYITGSWKSTAVKPKQYSSILVAALTNNTIAKATLENAMATALGKNISVLKSIDEFPPDINGQDSSKATIMNMLKNKNVDGILTISIVSSETETRYVPGTIPYEPLGHLYNNDFWGYYSYWYPYFYTPGYYVQDKVYFIETNLYDAASEKLAWSAQSKTYNPDDLTSFSKEFATTIVGKMRTDGVLPEAPKKSPATFSKRK